MKGKIMWLKFHSLQKVWNYFLISKQVDGLKEQSKKIFFQYSVNNSASKERV